MAALQDQYQLDVAAALTSLMTVEAAMNRIATQHNINLSLVGVQGMMGQVAQLQTALNSLGNHNVNLGGAQGANTAQMQALVQALNTATAAINAQTAAAAQNKTAMSAISPAATNVARSIKQLATEWQSGRIDAQQFQIQMGALKTQAEGMAAASLLGSRDALVLASALKTAGTAMGETARQASPVATEIETIRREVLGTRSAYQSHNASAKETIAALSTLQQRGAALLPTLQVGSADWLKLNTSMRTAAATVDKMQGKTPLLGIEDAMSGALGKLTPLLSTLGSFGGPLGGILNQVGALGSGFSGMGAEAALAAAPVAALGAAVLGLTAAIAASIQQAIPFEAGLKQLQALTGVDSQGISEMGQEFQKLSTELPITSNQFVEIGRNAALVGVHGKPEIEEFTKIMGQLGVLLRDTDGNMHDLEGTSRELAKFLNAAGIAGDAFIPALRVSASELITLKTHIGGTISEILNMSSFLVSLGTKMGLSTEQVLALSSAIASTGGKAQASGHAVARIIEEMQAASIHGGQAADEYAKIMGLTAEQFKSLTLHSPAEAFKRLAGSIDESTKKGASISEIFSTLGIKNVRLSQTLAEAAVAFPKLSSALDIAANAQKNQGDLAARAEVATASYRDQVKELDGAIISLAQGVGLHFLPTLTAIVKKTKEWVSGFQDIANNTETLKGYAEAAGIAIGGLTAAMLLNSKAARAMFEADAVASVGGKLFSAGIMSKNITVAIPALGKLKDGVLQLANAASKAKGFAAINEVFAFVPAAAAAALAGVALLAAGVGVYALKIEADIGRIQAVNEKNEQQAFENVLARVAKLNALGDPISKQKARSLLALQALQQAQQGEVVGSDIGGNAIYKVDDAQVKKAQAYYDQTNEKLRELQKAHENAAVSGYALMGHEGKLAEATHHASEMFGELSDKLSDIGAKFADTKMTTFQRNLKESRDEVARFRAEVARDYKSGKIDGAERKTLLNRADNLESRNAVTLTQRQLKEDSDTRMKHERTVQDALLAVQQDGAAKRRVELQRQLADSKKAYDEEITAALQNAKSAPTPTSRRAFYAEVAQLQKDQAAERVALEAQANQDLEKIDADRLAKARQAHQQLLEAQASSSAAGVKELESQRDAALALAGESAQGKLAIEQRYGPQIAAIQRQQLEVSAQAQRIAAQATLTQSLADAKTAGAQRGELEKSARALYATQVANIEKGLDTDRANATLTQEKRVQEQRLAIYKEGLDKRLATLSEATGKEIGQMERVLQAERVQAVAQGDGGRVSAIDGALKQIQSQKLDNVKAFAKDLTTASDKAADLQGKLREVAETPLQKAVKSAASPFDSAIKEAQSQLTDLHKAYEKVSDPSPEQNAAMRRQQASLTGIIMQATTERNRVAGQAAAEFYREQADKAQDHGLAMSKRELDQGKLTMDGYAQVLAADRAYWQTRRSNAAAGSQEAQTADEKLRTNEDERLRLEGERRDLAKDAAAFKREELVRSVQLAHNEIDRSAALDKLNAADSKRLSDLDTQIAGLQTQGGHEKEILTLQRERATLQQDGLSRQQQEIEHAKSLRDATLGLVEAETALAAKTAHTDAEAAAARQQAVQNAYARLSGLDGDITNAKSDEERKKLLAERVNLTGQIIDLERQAATAPLEAEGQRLEVSKSLAALALQRSGLSDDEVAQAQLGVQNARQELDLKRKLWAEAQQKGNPTEQRNAQLAVAQAELGVEQARQQLAQARYAQEQRTLDMQHAVAQANLKINNMADDAVAMAQVDLGISRDQLQVAHQKANDESLSAKEREDARKQEIDLTGQIAEQERKVAEAVRERARLIDALSESHQKLVTEAQGGAEDQQKLAQSLDAVAAARQNTARAQEEYEQALSKGTPKEVLAATDKLTSGIAAQRQALNGLADAYQSQINAMDSVREAADSLRKTMYGDVAANLKSGVDAVIQASQRLREAQAADQQKSTAETKKNLAEQQKAYDQAQANLGKTRAGVDTNREMSRFSAMEQRRDAAVNEADAAMRNGDKARITKALQDLDKLERRYREQGELLKNAGVGVNLKGEGAVRDVADRADDLGINYDKEAAQYASLETSARTQAQAASNFLAGVGAFNQILNNLRSNNNTTVNADGSVTTQWFEYDGKRFNSMADIDDYIKGKKQAQFTPAHVDTALQVQVSAAMPAAPQGVATSANQSLSKTYAPVYNLGGITVNAAPGIDGDALARELAPKILTEINRETDANGGCPL